MNGWKGIWGTFPVNLPSIVLYFNSFQNGGTYCIICEASKSSMLLFRIVSDRLIFFRCSIRAPGAGSDHKTFYMRLGIPIVDIRYTYNWVSKHDFCEPEVNIYIVKTFHFLQGGQKKEPIPSVLKVLRGVFMSNCFSVSSYQPGPRKRVRVVAVLPRK